MKSNKRKKEEKEKADNKGKTKKTDNQNCNLNYYLSKEDYDIYFGITDQKTKSKVITNEKEQAEDFSKVKAAYERAWINRDFEIDKFWSRTSYFWAFILLCFTGYGFLKYGYDNPSHIDLLAISALGIISSFIWGLSIIASKRWQENWEKHIDCLEDYVTGPLYKTLVYKRFVPSVSKLNLSLALIILFVWIVIFIIELYNAFKWSIPKLFDNKNGYIFILSSLIIVIVLILMFSVKYNIIWSQILKRKKRFEQPRSPEDYFEKKENDNKKDNK